MIDFLEEQGMETFGSPWWVILSVLMSWENRRIYQSINSIGVILVESRSMPLHSEYIDEDDDDDDDDVYNDDDDFAPYDAVSGEDIWFLNDEGELVYVNLEEDDSSESLEETRSVIHERVFFYLYTLENPNEHQELFVNDEQALANSNFDASKPTVFLIHGWINSYKSLACTKPRNAYLKSYDYNVIVVDWSKISFRLYRWASNRVKMVGTRVALMVDFLEKQGMDLSRTTVVGHSLGAHIAGLTGYHATNTVAYIVGMDPALPQFRLAKPGSRISQGDGEFVEIIHTNGGQLGFKTAIGDADFYPNGGSRQPGCELDFSGTCSHARSYSYFAESLANPKKFYGTVCESYISYRMGLCKSGSTAIMGGIHLDTSANGTYYLRTNEKSHFARGH